MASVLTSVHYLAEPEKKRNPVTSDENIDPELAGAERPPITTPAAPTRTTPTSKYGIVISLAQKASGAEKT